MTNAEELRLLTILFADLSGFTSLSQHLDPEDVSEVINTCFEQLNPTIIKYGGTIHKYEGDLIIALFGFPVAHEDDPERAIKSSLEMLSLLPEINKTLATKLQRKVKLGLHIGINSGTVMIAEIGSKEKKEYTVMGDTVNLASRLKDIARQGEIFVSEPVYCSSNYLFEYKILPPVKIKGIENRVRIFKPLRIKASPASKRGIQGFYSPILGRNDELKLLSLAMENLQKGRGGAFFILGEAGIGKSRLLLEFKKLIKKDHLPINILEGCGISYGETIAYLPFLQILRQIFKITETDAVKVIKQNLMKRTKEVFPKEWKDVLPYLGYLFSIRFDGKLDEKIRHLDAPGLKLQIFLSLRKLFFALSQRKPILLAIEDIHWIDAGSLEFLHFLFATRKSPALLFLGTSRTDKRGEFWSVKERLKKILGTNFQEIILKPLDYETTKQLALNLLKAPRIAEELCTKILAKVEGNPFYLEEILRSLTEPQVRQPANQTLLVRTKIVIPDTVYGVIASRMDSLEPDVKEILQMASVVGKNFRLSILEYISDKKRLELNHTLTTLENLDYITHDGKETDPEYTFKHPLFQEVAYKSLLKKQRRELHQKTAGCIEKLFSGRLPDFYELLSHQYYASGNWDKAYEYSIKAAQKNKKIYNNKAAIEFYEMAIESLKDCKSRIKEKIEAMREMVEVYSLIGEQVNALRDIKRAIALAKKINDKFEQTRCLDTLCRVYQGMSRYKLMKNEALKALTIYKKLKDKMGESMSLKSIGVVYSVLGKYPKALKYYNLSLKIDRKTGNTDGEAINLNRIGVIHFLMGNYEKALRYYHESLLKIKKLDDRRREASILNNIGIIYRNIGEYKKANKYYQDALRISTQIGERQVMARALNNLAIIHKELGDYERALDFYKKSLKISEEINNRRGEAISLHNIGEIYYLLGDYKFAMKFYQNSLRLARDIGYQRLETMNLNNLGNLLTNIGDYKQALISYQHSLKIAGEIGDHKTEVENLIGIGNLLVERENYLKAEDYLKHAYHESKKIKSKSIQAETLYSLGLLYLSKSYNKRPMEIYKNLKRLTSQLHLKEFQAKTLLLSARLYSLKSDFEKSIAIYKKIKNKFELAKVYYYYGIFLKNQQAINQAKEYRKRARKLFKKIGAKGWLEKFERIDGG